MANTYTALYYYVVFGTNNRVAYIKPEIESYVCRLDRRRGAQRPSCKRAVQSSLTRRGDE